MSRTIALLTLLVALEAASFVPAYAAEDASPVFVAPEAATDEDLSSLVVREKQAGKAKAAPVAEKKRADVVVEPPPAVRVEEKRVVVEEKKAEPKPVVIEAKPVAAPVKSEVVEEKKAVAVQPEEKKPVVEQKPVEAKPSAPAPAVVAVPEEKKTVVEQKPVEVKPAAAAPAVVAAPEVKKPVEEPKPAIAEKKPQPEVVPAQPAVTAAEKKTEPVAPTAAAPVTKEVTVSASAADLAAPLPESEQKMLDLINQAFGAQGRSFFQTRKPQRIYAGQAVLKGVEKNLSIQRQEKQEDISKAARSEARAIFDPVFTVSFNHSLNTTNNRLEKVTKFSRAIVDDKRNPGTFVEDIADLSTPKIPIKDLQFSAPRPAGTKLLTKSERAIASDENINGPDQTDAPSLNITQQLPWGPIVFLTANSKKNESFFDDGPDPILDLKQQLAKQALAAEQSKPVAEQDAALVKRLTQDAFDTKQAFDRSARKFTSTSRPWSSSFSGGFATPIPGTKDWGSKAGVDLGIKLADLTSERTYWDTKTVVNNTLASIDFAYWDLVGGVENLRAVTENHKLLSTLQANIKKQLDLGRTTQYGMLQVDAQVAGVKEQEEAAWANFIQASNNLISLLDDDKDSVFLPAGWTKAMGEQIKWKPEEALHIATENRPELKAQKIGGQTSQVLLDFARNQVKPDLKYTMNFTVSQNSKPFGYASLGQSLDAMFGEGKTGRHLIEVPVKGVFTPVNLTQVKQVWRNDDTAGPDNRVHSHTLTYNYPLHNRGVKADLKTAIASRDQQDIITDITLNSIEQDIGNAVVNLLSSKEQYDIAQETYSLAASAYGDVTKLLDAGRVTEFEIVSRNRDLLTADLVRVAAAIAYKKAETELLRAEGILPNAYPGLHTMGGMDDERIKLLSSRRALKFFQPIPVESTPIEKGAAKEGVAATASETPAAPVSGN